MSSTESSQPAGGPAPSDGTAADADRAAPAREWLAQLQAMIENLATQAVPVVREIGAKAAELAAVAAEKAGPIAARAAEVTADAGTRFAERSRNLATELRRDAEAAAPAGPGVAASDGVGESPAEATSPTEPRDGSPSGS